jgi:hypothetical protein
MDADRGESFFRRGECDREGAMAFARKSSGAEESRKGPDEWDSGHRKMERSAVLKPDAYK